MFNVLEPQVCFQEVPGHIALGFVCTGCPLRCPGCHRVDTWDPKHGRYVAELGGLASHLTNQRFIEIASGKVLNSLFLKG